MVSAPGWAVHNHASYDESPVYELTMQDQPLNIDMESLLWQESLELSWPLLGVEEGFGTNRERDRDDEPRRKRTARLDPAADHAVQRRRGRLRHLCAARRMPDREGGHGILVNGTTGEPSTFSRRRAQPPRADRGRLRKEAHPDRRRDRRAIVAETVSADRRRRKGRRRCAADRHAVLHPAAAARARRVLRRRWASAPICR